MKKKKNTMENSRSELDSSSQEPLTESQEDSAQEAKQYFEAGVIKKLEKMSGHLTDGQRAQIKEIYDSDDVDKFFTIDNILSELEKKAASDSSVLESPPDASQEGVDTGSIRIEPTKVEHTEAPKPPKEELVSKEPKREGTEFVKGVIDENIRRLIAEELETISKTGESEIKINGLDLEGSTLKGLTVEDLKEALIAEFERSKLIKVSMEPVYLAFNFFLDKLGEAKNKYDKEKKGDKNSEEYKRWGMLSKITRELANQIEGNDIYAQAKERLKNLSDGQKSSLKEKYGKGYGQRFIRQLEEDVLEKIRKTTQEKLSEMPKPLQPTKSAPVGEIQKHEELERPESPAPKDDMPEDSIIVYDDEEPAEEERTKELPQSTGLAPAGETPGAEKERLESGSESEFFGVVQKFREDLNEGRTGYIISTKLEYGETLREHTEPTEGVYEHTHYYEYGRGMPDELKRIVETELNSGISFTFDKSLINWHYEGNQAIFLEPINAQKTETIKKAPKRKGFFGKLFRDKTLEEIKVEEDVPVTMKECGVVGEHEDEELCAFSIFYLNHEAEYNMRRPGLSTKIEFYMRKKLALQILDEIKKDPQNFWRFIESVEQTLLKKTSPVEMDHPMIAVYNEYNGKKIDQNSSPDETLTAK